MDVKYKIDLAIVLLSVFALIGIVGYAQLLVIAPLNDLETFDTSVLFSIEKAGSLIIDDNLDFTTPDEYEVKDGLELDLSPGVYYWKVRGIGFSEIRTLTIKSKVSLKLVETEDDFVVINDGNMRLNLEVYNGTELVEERKLNPNEQVSTVGTKIIGEQNG